MDHLVEPPRHKEKTLRWQSEFWGEWTQGAIVSYRYGKSSELCEITESGVESLMKIQLPNGCIDDYPEEAQLNQWDIWGRKYTALGLIAYYDLSRDRKALDTACRMINHLITQAGSGEMNIMTTGNHTGVPNSSVLKPVMHLHDRTRQDKYPNFVKYIAKQWEAPEGPRLIGRAVADILVAERSPHPRVWLSPENGRKAYEMMPCYKGLLEPYKITEDPSYLSVVEKTINHTINEEIDVAGSGSALECWYEGKALQAYPTYCTVETCATFTWMQICNRILGLTGNSLHAGQIEKTIYNTLLASLGVDIPQIAEYGPLEG